MPIEDINDGLVENPLLHVAQWIFTLSRTNVDATIVSQTSDKLMNAIKENNMAPVYAEVCKRLGWTVDEPLLDRMKAANEQELRRLEETIVDAEQNLGDTDVREALLRKSEFYSLIGDKNNAVKWLRLTFEKTASLGNRLDVVFHLIRIGFFFMDHELIKNNIDKAKSLMEEGGDWDRRNRLNVYRAIYLMSVRQFDAAVKLFLDTISTFTCTELMPYSDFVKYTVYISLIALPRNQLREKVIRGSEILEVLHGQPEAKELVFSLYECRYADFFKSVAVLEQILLGDRYTHLDARFYVREVRIKAYSQLLESYSSLSLVYMAQAFGVSVDFIDRELSRFINLGRLHAKIDKVGGIVETTRPDSKNHQYQTIVREGDALLNRVQKLSRVINL